MAQGSKDKYTDKQKRQAEHIADGYQEQGVSKQTAKARAWATVNKQTGGGNKGGRSMTKAQRSAAAKKGWETRRRKAKSARRSRKSG